MVDHRWNVLGVQLAFLELEGDVKGHSPERLVDQVAQLALGSSAKLADPHFGHLAGLPQLLAHLSHFDVVAVDGALADPLLVPFILKDLVDPGRGLQLGDTRIAEQLLQLLPDIRRQPVYGRLADTHPFGTGR